MSSFQQLWFESGYFTERPQQAGNWQSVCFHHSRVPQLKASGCLCCETVKLVRINQEVSVCVCVLTLCKALERSEDRWTERERLNVSLNFLPLQQTSDKLKSNNRKWRTSEEEEPPANQKQLISDLIRVETIAKHPGSVIIWCFQDLLWPRPAGTSTSSTFTTSWFTN